MGAVLVGVFVGFVVIWIVASKTDIAWPWYCLIGGLVNVVVALVASWVIDGRQQEYSPYTIRGQQKLFSESGKADSEDGWYVLPGRIDKPAYGLIVFFLASCVLLYAFQELI